MNREQTLWAISLWAGRQNLRDDAGAFQYPPVAGAVFLLGRTGPIEIASAATWLAAADQRAAELQALERARAIWPTAEGWACYRVAVVEICAVKVENCVKAFG